MKPLLDLEPRECRWPVETHGKDHLFCGHPVEPGSPYCKGHGKMAYKPNSALDRLGEGALDRLADSYAGSRHRGTSGRGGKLGESYTRDVVAVIATRTDARTGALHQEPLRDPAAEARRLPAQNKAILRKRHAFVQVLAR